MCIITLGNNIILPFSSWRGAISSACDVVRVQVLYVSGVVLRSIVGTPRRDEDGSDAVSTGCSLLCGRAGRGSRLITLLVLIYVCVNLHCYDGVDQ